MSKRKRVVLNFQQKLEILRQLNEGKSGTILAKQYGIGTSTISDIKRNADSILQFVSNLECEKHISEKKTRKTAQNTDLDSRVYKWYVEEKKKGAVPSDSAVCSKALEVNQQLTNGSQNFKASLGWLRHFKNRHGLEEVKEPCEESPTSATVALPMTLFYFGSLCQIMTRVEIQLWLLLVRTQMLLINYPFV
ncbi:hypothetical protein GEV33_004939 [Tenebrio molitor]|uniref:HTH CENPB-type domain-containing protein n=1 Tax=Tenebrio molitor TaxID=7067 RepID=A0A8J6LF93_TENMO|nr:hypothetical protein GEV33_004939 [Tenebrio molitor]